MEAFPSFPKVGPYIYIYFYFYGEIRGNKIAGSVYDDRLTADDDQTVKKFYYKGR